MAKNLNNFKNTRTTTARSNAKRNSEGYLQLHISDDQLAHAKFLADHSHFPDENKRTTLVGFLGETVVADLMGCNRPDGKPDKGYDLLLFGRKVDVKTMERSTDVIKKHYANNVSKRQSSNDTEYYIFCSVNMDTRNVIISCIMPKNVFLRKAKLYKKDKLPKNDAGKQIRDKCGDTLVLLNEDVEKQYIVGSCESIGTLIRADIMREYRTPGIKGRKAPKKAGYKNGKHYKGL